MYVDFFFSFLFRGLGKEHKKKCEHRTCLRESERERRKRDLNSQRRI